MPAVEKHDSASGAVGYIAAAWYQRPWDCLIHIGTDPLTPVVNDQCANGGQGGAEHPVVMAAQQESNQIRRA